MLERRHWRAERHRFGSGATDTGGSSSIADFFSGSSAKAPQTATGAQPDVNCPSVEIRRGASTLTLWTDRATRRR